MKKIITAILTVLVFNISVLAQNIKDIPKKSGDYSAVKKVVRGGYLSLFNKNTFQPDRSISRRELAVVIDKILTKIDKQGMNLKKSEVQELVNLAKMFKKYLVNYDINHKVVKKKINNLNKDQTIIHHDMSKINNEVKDLKKENQDQFLFIIGSCVLAAVGILI